MLTDPYQIRQLLRLVERYSRTLEVLDERLPHQHLLQRDDGGYIADITDLDACSAFGETPEQAVVEVLHAREAWLVVAAETGRNIPKLRY